MSQIPNTLLNDGNLMPQLGLGTFKLCTKDGDDMVKKTVQSCFENGYRLIDTAGCYRNEQDLGASIKDSLAHCGYDRSNLFITSKLAPKDMGYDEAIRAFQKSLSDLDCKYLDLYLIHWPGKRKLKLDDPAHKDYRQKAWQALEDIKKKGYVKSIGVSNFTCRHLNELFEYSTILPAVNQVEFHPHLHQKNLLEFCRKKNIFLQAYSSLGTGELVANDVVGGVSKSLNKTSAQILLRWGIQHGVGVIPKSTNPIHIRENPEIFDFKLSDQDMDLLNNMNLNTHYCWDPNTVL